MRYIFKFGGSSLSSVEKIKKIAEYIKKIKTREDLELVVVVSAMGKTTNHLDTLAQSITKFTNNTAYSSLLSIGENISTYLLTLALENLGVSAIGLTSKDIKICAMGAPNFGIITHIDTNKISEYLSDNKVVVVSGFQGENQLDQTITLGRGGSDTTAVALGSILNATVKIFTDVKGFYSLSPQSYLKPKLLKYIPIHSAINLSCINAKVLDYRSLCLANQNKVNLTVLESMKYFGTQIAYNNIENYRVDGISSKNKIIFVKNTLKNKQLLQNILTTTNLKTYFYIKDDEEKWAVDANQKTLKALLSIYKIKPNIYSADILIVSGSGFLIHKEFNQKVQKIISEHKIKVLYYNLTQTDLFIVCKQAPFLEALLAQEFNLVEE